MAIARITTSGLSSIAILVALLWGCIIGERVVVRKADREFSRALTEIRTLQMKKRAEPAAAPAQRWKARPAKPAMG